MHRFESLKPAPQRQLAADAVVDLVELDLSMAARARRRAGIGGPDALVIASGDKKATERLARVKRGEQHGADLGEVLPVQLGHWLEPFSLAWFEREGGMRVHGRGEVLHRMVDGTPRYAALAGACWAEDGTRPAVLLAKASSDFEPIKSTIAKYWPQVQHEMFVTGWDLAFLLVVQGLERYVCQPIDFDPVYWSELARLEARFWRAVRTGEGLEPAKLPPPMLDLSAVVEVDMTGDAAWAAHAAAFLAARGAAERLAAAREGICRAMLDARAAYGHGISARRARDGRVTVVPWDYPRRRPTGPRKTPPGPR